VKAYLAMAGRSKLPDSGTGETISNFEYQMTKTFQIFISSRDWPENQRHHTTVSRELKRTYQKRNDVCELTKIKGGDRN